MRSWAWFNSLFITPRQAFGSRRGPRRSSLARAARLLAALVVGVEALYLAAANCLLAFEGLPKLFAGTASVEANVASGWTVLPGVVHARGLRITFQDHNVQAVVEMARVDVVISLHELVSHVFHATKVRGSGLVFRVRNRVQPDAKDRASTRALPPIRGFEDPPVYQAWAPEAPISDADYNLWTVHVEDVDVHADELWVEQFRYLGSARAVGAFELKPARYLWVRPASLELQPGRVVAAGRDAFTSFSGRIECTVHPFDVRVPDGFAVLRYISAKTALRGEFAGGEFLELFTPPAWKSRVEPRGARLVVETAIERGVVLPPSRVAVEGDSLRVRVGPVVADAAGPWSVVGTGAAQGGGGRLVATVSRALVSRYGSDAAPVTGRGLVAGASSTTLDTTAAWAVRAADLTIGDLAAPDLSVLRDVWLGSARLRGGAGALHGRVAYSSGRLSGAGAVDLRDAVADVSQMEIRGTASLNAASDAFDVQQATGSVDVGLLGSRISVADASGAASCSWGRFQKLDAQAHVLLRSRGRASGKIDASADGATLGWRDARVSANADLRATVEPTGEGDAGKSRVAGVVRVFRLRVRNGVGPPKRWSADVPETTLDGALVLQGAKLEGPVEIVSRRAHVAIGHVSMRSDVRAGLRLAQVDLDRRSGILSGAVNVTSASLWNGDRRVEGWWAKMGISRTRIVAGKQLELDGRISARFRDGLPGLLSLSETDAIPAFLPDLLPLHGLVGTIDVHRRCRLTDIQFSRIKGGPLTASGRIQSVPGETRGAVLIRVSGLELLSAGLSLGEHGDGFSLFAGDEWLHQQTDDLRRAAATVAARGCPSTSGAKCN